MATIRQHLQEMHQAASENHAKLADACGDVSKCFSSMSKAAPSSDGETYAKIASAFDKMAKVHAAAADAHAGFADDCEKAHQDALEKTLVPDRFSSIAPSDNFGIRAVPRNGQPDTFGKVAETV